MNYKPTLKRAVVTVWMDLNGVDWHGRHFKPSQMIAMGAVLQEAGLKMLGEPTIDEEIDTGGKR